MTKSANPKDEVKNLFNQVRNSFLDYDPAHFIQNNLTLDGDSFSILGNGWKFMADVYRYIALQASRKNGKPVVIKKGRQVGATMMAGALDLYFTNSGLFAKPPIKVAHFFPSLGLRNRFSQEKLENLIRGAKNDFINVNKLTDGNVADNLSTKQFKTGTLWIESIGTDADRVRGMTIDVAFFDECFVGKQNVEVESGKMSLSKIYKMKSKNKDLPKVMSFNEKNENFEYKKILNVWKKEKKELLEIKLGQNKIKCTQNHRFLTSEGWKAAKDLHIGDLIKSKHDYGKSIKALNEDQLQIILGSFLGDGNIRREGQHRYRLRMTHGLDQREYCEWKASMLDAKVYDKKPSGYSNKESVFMSSTYFGLKKEFPKVKTVCPQWVLDELDLRGVAIWIMDDGSSKFKNNKFQGLNISTDSFDEDSQKRFVDYFKKYDIKCEYRFSNRSGDKFKKSSYPSLHFNQENGSKLLDLIKPYVHNNIGYKIPNFSKNECNYNWNKLFKKYTYNVVDKISSVKKKEYVYDIEVEDNHNFIVCSSGPRLGGPIAHNCQDMVGLAINNATKTLTASKYGQLGSGVQVYFGTPKEKGTWFETTWEMSDQRYYHLGCKNCKNTFPFYQPNHPGWKDIWISGYDIKCPLCGTIQHKVDAIEHGKWVPSKNTDDCKYIGFHINQFYIPNLTREVINDLMPENNPNQSERAWNNEVVGEFYAGVGMPLTRSHIEIYCKDENRAFSRKIESRDRKTYLGADWGDKAEQDSRGQSFSCAVILSDAGNGTLLIEFAHILKERSFSYKKATIHELYKRFGVRQGVADFFFGQDVVRDLQSIYGERFLGSQGSGALLNAIKYREDELMITYNKDLLIEELFDKMKKGKIRFPWKSYENIEWLINHCTSMGTALREKSGQQVKTYVKGTTPNDGLMALMYAYMAWKFDTTNKFTIKPGKPNESGILKSTLAFAPRLK
jgi:hypothetical protein